MLCEYCYLFIGRYLGASYDVPSLVDKLLHQLASKQTIVVNVYDTTNASAPITMYGTDVADTGLLYISSLDFGDPLRKHEMHCRFAFTPKKKSCCVQTIEISYQHNSFLFSFSFAGSSRGLHYLGQQSMHQWGCLLLLCFWVIFFMQQ